MVDPQRGVRRRRGPVACRAAGVRRGAGQAAPDGPRIDFAPLKQPSGKIITAFAVRAISTSTGTRQQHLHLEWPKGSGNVREYPEIDRVGWFSVAAARSKLLKGQRPLLDHLMECGRRRRTGRVSIALIVSARPWMRQPDGVRRYSSS